MTDEKQEHDVENKPADPAISRNVFRFGCLTLLVVFVIIPFVYTRIGGWFPKIFLKRVGFPVHCIEEIIDHYDTHAPPFGNGTFYAEIKIREDKKQEFIAFIKQGDWKPLPLTEGDRNTDASEMPENIQNGYYTMSDDQWNYVVGIYDIDNNIIYINFCDI